MSRNSLFVVTLLAALFAVDAGADAQGRAARTQPTRDGLFLQGGLWFPGNADAHPWFRAEVGLHLARLTRADLYLQIPAMISGDSYAYAGGSYGWFGFAVTPGVRGEWTFFNRKGDLAAFLEGGAGIMLYSWRDCDISGFCPGSDTMMFGLLRSGAGVTYTAPFGLMVSVQPVGFGWAIGDDWYDGGFYDGYLMVGYRWQ